MARIFESWFMTPSTEISIISTFGIAQTAMECYWYLYEGKSHNILKALHSREYFTPIEEKVIMTILDVVFFLQNIAAPAYLATYVFLYCTVIRDKNPALLVPWLLVGCIRNLLLDAVATMTALFICYAVGFPQQCFHASIAAGAELAIQVYLWGSVLRLYQEMAFRDMVQDGDPYISLAAAQRGSAELQQQSSEAAAPADSERSQDGVRPLKTPSKPGPALLSDDVTTLSVDDQLVAVAQRSWPASDQQQTAFLTSDATQQQETLLTSDADQHQETFLTSDTTELDESFSKYEVTQRLKLSLTSEQQAALTQEETGQHQISSLLSDAAPVEDVLPISDVIQNDVADQQQQTAFSIINAAQQQADIPTPLAPQKQATLLTTDEAQNTATLLTADAIQKQAAFLAAQAVQKQAPFLTADAVEKQMVTLVADVALQQGLALSPDEIKKQAALLMVGADLQQAMFLQPSAAQSQSAVPVAEAARLSPNAAQQQAVLLTSNTVDQEPTFLTPSAAPNHSVLLPADGSNKPAALLAIDNQHKPAFPTGDATQKMAFFLTADSAQQQTESIMAEAVGQTMAVLWSQQSAFGIHTDAPGLLKTKEPAEAISQPLTVSSPLNPSTTFPGPEPLPNATLLPSTSSCSAKVSQTSVTGHPHGLSKVAGCQMCSNRSCKATKAVQANTLSRRWLTKHCACEPGQSCKPLPERLPRGCRTTASPYSHRDFSPPSLNATSWLDQPDEKTLNP